MHKEGRNRGERASALLEFAVSAPLFAVLIYGLAQLTRLAAARYQLAVVTHSIMREVEGGTRNEIILTGLANAYAAAGGRGSPAALAVSLEPANCSTLGMARIAPGVFRSVAARFAPGVRVRVRGVVPVSGLIGMVWKAGIPMECSVVCLPDPWKSPMGRLMGLLGIGEGGGK